VKSNSSKIEFFVPLFTVLSDFLAILLAFFISYQIRFFTPFGEYFEVTKGIPPFGGYLFFAVITLPVWFMVFQSFKMYRLNRTVFVFDELFLVIKCVTIAVLISMGIIFFYRDFPFSRLVFILLWFFTITFSMIGRYVMLKIEKNLYNKNIGVKNVAIVGTNEMALKIYDKFTRDKFAGFNVLGYFTKDGSSSENLAGKNLIGSYSDLPEKIKSLKLEKILIALPSNQHDDLYTLIQECEGINVEFMLAPDFIETITSKLKMEEVDGIPFLKLKSLPMNIWNRFLKRTFDVIVSGFILFVISPIMIILALAVKFTSKGPVFYKQERVGLDGKKFMMLKFRSMKIDAESSGPQMAKQDDDRYSPIGLFLRKYSLDELPQFINVLKGDMSIVGPRPEREFFINQMRHSIKNYLERHRVKCGVTGWAQVNGLRGDNTSMQTRIDYDIYYIENWSLAFDIKIILKTFREMFFSKEAF
jgi:Undecaprenyl-phosphate glucose phosphotransferase